MGAEKKVKNPKAVRRGRLNKQKGKEYEREVSKAFRELWPLSTRRGQLQSQSSSVDSDVHGTPYWIECKNQQKLSIPKTIQQMRDELKAHRKRWPGAYPRGPIICHKVHFKGDFVTLPIEEFLEIWRELLLLRSANE